jgi:hypothetical protein
LFLTTTSIPSLDNITAHPQHLRAINLINDTLIYDHPDLNAPLLL